MSWDWPRGIAYALAIVVVAFVVLWLNANTDRDCTDRGGHRVTAKPWWETSRGDDGKVCTDNKGRLIR